MKSVGVILSEAILFTSSRTSLMKSVGIILSEAILLIISRCSLMKSVGVIMSEAILLLLVIPHVTGTQVDPVEFFISSNHSTNKTLIPLPEDFKAEGCCALVATLTVKDPDSDCSGHDYEKGRGHVAQSGVVTFKFNHPHIRKDDKVFTMEIKKDEEEVKKSHILNFDNCGDIAKLTFDIYATANNIDEKDVGVVLVKGEDEDVSCADPITEGLHDVFLYDILLYKDPNFKYYKIPVPESLKLTSASIVETCSLRGLAPLCWSGKSQHSYNDDNCTRAQDCQNYSQQNCAQALAKILCNTEDPKSCSSTVNLFWYMAGDWQDGSAYGVTKDENGKEGKDVTSTRRAPNFAACVQPVVPAITGESSASPEEEVLMHCSLKDYPDAQVSFDTTNQDGEKVVFHTLTTNSITLKINDVDTSITVTCNGIGKGNGPAKKSITIDHQDCFLRNRVSNVGYDHTRKLADAPALCQQLCAKDEKCIAFDWTRNDAACLLLENTKNATRKIGWITGPKHCPKKEVETPWIWIIVLVLSLTSIVALILLFTWYHKKSRTYRRSTHSPPRTGAKSNSATRTVETTLEADDEGLYDAIKKDPQEVGKKMKGLKKCGLDNTDEENCYVTVTGARSGPGGNTVYYESASVSEEGRSGPRGNTVYYESPSLSEASSDENVYQSDPFVL